MAVFKNVTIEQMRINGTFISKRELKKFFPSIHSSFKNILGAFWNEEEKKLKVLMINKDDSTLEIWTFEL